MSTKRIVGGVVHQVPADLRAALLAKKAALAAWESITPLARNEWICWTTSVKRQETRAHHIKRAVQELAGGTRRPCCWVGCTHRSDKAISASQKWVLSRQSKKTK